jgi:hypothetical protein
VTVSAYRLLIHKIGYLPMSREQADLLLTVLFDSTFSRSRCAS